MTKVTPCVHQDCAYYREYYKEENGVPYSKDGELNMLHVCHECKHYERFNLLSLKDESNDTFRF